MNVYLKVDIDSNSGFKFNVNIVLLYFEVYFKRFCVTILFLWVKLLEKKLYLSIVFTELLYNLFS